MRISDWSSDVCSSDLRSEAIQVRSTPRSAAIRVVISHSRADLARSQTIASGVHVLGLRSTAPFASAADALVRQVTTFFADLAGVVPRSEESRVGNEGVSTCSYRWSPIH